MDVCAPELTTTDEEEEDEKSSERSQEELTCDGTETYLINEDEPGGGYAYDDDITIISSSIVPNVESQIYACNVTVGAISSHEIDNQDDAWCVKRCLPEAYKVEQLKPIPMRSHKLKGRTDIYCSELSYHIFFPPQTRTSCKNIEEVLIKNIEQKFRAKFGHHVQVKMVHVIDVNESLENSSRNRWSGWSSKNASGPNDKELSPIPSESLEEFKPPVPHRNNKTVKFDFCYMTSNPIVMESGYPIPQIDFTEEADGIVKIIKDCGKEVRYCRIVATITNFDVLMQKKVRILHFSGHGRQGKLDDEATTELMFENEKPEKFGMSQDFHCQELINLLRKRDHGLQLVFVSACYSRWAGNAFIKAGVPYVVCVTQNAAVPVEAAIQFMKVFYRFILVHDWSIPRAFKHSQDHLKVKNYVVWSEMFELIVNKETKEEKDKIYLKKGVFRDLSTELNPGAVHTPRPPFARRKLIGSALHMKRVIQGLMTKRLVVIYNSHWRAIGKTALAQMSTYYIVDRGKVDRLIWVDRDSIHTIQENEGKNMSLDLILCYMLLKEVRKYEERSNRVKRIENILNSSPNRGSFSQIITEFFYKERVLVILDGADSWRDSWFLSKRQKMRKKKIGTSGNIWKDVRKGEERKDWIEQDYESWSSEQAKKFIFEITKSHDNLKILVTCREWNSKAKTATPYELIKLPRLTFEDAALLFITSIPVWKQLRAEDFEPSGKKGALSPEDMAEHLSKKKQKPLTISYTECVPGLIEKLAHTFQDVQSFRCYWEKQELLQIINDQKCACKIKYGEIKKYILQHLEDERDDVINKLCRNFRSRGWDKRHIVSVYNTLCIPTNEDMWKKLEQRASCKEDSNQGWTYILELETKRTQHLMNEWTKHVQNWREQLRLRFPDKLVRYQHVLYATLEVIRRRINPKSRKWGIWENEWCIELMKWFAKGSPNYVMYEPIFKNYWGRIKHWCSFFADYQAFFDTGIRGPCLLHAFVSRETSHSALQGKRCPNCEFNDKNNVYECKKFPYGHPKVPSGSFLLRMAKRTKNVVVVYKTAQDEIIQQEIFSGSTAKGCKGFSESSKKHSKHYLLPELVMRMETLKYVFWPNAPIDPISGETVHLDKKFCYESSFIPG